MKEFEIWTEGYQATGESDGPKFHGKQKAASFDEACILKIGHMLDKNEKEPFEYRRFGGRLCVWACRCFDPNLYPL